jgi:hypothetical protein
MSLLELFAHANPHESAPSLRYAFLFFDELRPPGTPVVRFSEIDSVICWRGLLSLYRIFRFAEQFDLAGLQHASVENVYPQPVKITRS